MFNKQNMQQPQVNEEQQTKFIEAVKQIISTFGTTELAEEYANAVKHNFNKVQDLQQDIVAFQQKAQSGQQVDHDVAKLLTAIDLLGRQDESILWVLDSSFVLNSLDKIGMQMPDNVQVKNLTPETLKELAETLVHNEKTISGVLDELEPKIKQS